MNQIKFILLITIFIFSITKLEAQSRGIRYIQASSFDLVIGGDYGLRLIQNNSTNPEIIEQANNRTRFENFKLNTRFGINYYQGISQNLTIKTGFRFSNPGFSTSKIEKIDLDQDINTINKKYDPIGPEYKFNYHLFEVPIGIKYTLTNSFCQPYFEIGIATNYYWRTRVIEILNDSNSQSKFINENINQFNYIGFIGIGGNFIINHNLAGFTQLLGRYQLNNLRKSNFVEKLTSLGIEVGLRYFLVK